LLRGGSVVSWFPHFPISHFSYSCHT
jgi:hypothetical protein